MSFLRNIWWNLAYPLTVNRVRLSAPLTVICRHLRLGRRLGAFQIHTIRWRHSRLAPLTVTVTVSVAFRNVSNSLGCTKLKHNIFYTQIPLPSVSKYVFTRIAENKCQTGEKRRFNLFSLCSQNCKQPLIILRYCIKTRCLLFCRNSGVWKDNRRECDIWWKILVSWATSWVRELGETLLFYCVNRVNQIYSFLCKAIVIEFY